MEIRIYNPQLQLVGIIENFISLIWNRKYSAVGTFQFYVPTTTDSVNYLTLGNIISFDGATEAGVIESIELKQNNNSNELIASGRFLGSYLDRRLISGNGTPVYNFSGLVELAMRTLIENAEPIPLLELGSLKGFTDTITFQATYQNLLKYESKLANSANLGFVCIPDFVDKKIVFDVYKGLDHSESQSERVRVTFSEGFRNINSATYTENDQLLKNICYVGGQGEGAERTWVTVGDTTVTGLARREVRLDATDISPDNLTQEEYEAKLRERGETLLSNEDVMVQSFECDTIPNGNFKYREHYDLGDIVTIKKETWGVSTDLRITEITETYEHGALSIVPTFGTPLPDTIDWEDK